MTEQNDTPQTGLLTPEQIAEREGFPPGHVQVVREEMAAEQTVEATAIYVMPDEQTQVMLAVAMQDFFARTCVEVGTMLKQLGRRAAEIKPEEIQKFAKLHDVHVTKTTDGAIRYEITLKGKAPSWAKGGQ